MNERHRRYPTEFTISMETTTGELNGGSANEEGMSHANVTPVAPATGHLRVFAGDLFFSVLHQKGTLLRGFDFRTRPHSITPSSAAYSEGRLALDVDEILRLGAVPLGTRISAMLGGQAMLFGIKRAQLERRYPKLSAREIVLKLFEELQERINYASFLTSFFTLPCFWCNR